MINRLASYATCVL